MKNYNQRKFINHIKLMYTEKDNIFPKPMTDREFVDIITSYILGKNWYTPNPVSQEQVNVYQAIAIIEKINVKEK